MSVDRTSKLIAIIDDDEAMQDSLRDLMEAAGLVARCFGSAEEFLESDLHTRAACLIVDIRMPKMSGLELQARLKEEECNIPINLHHGSWRCEDQNSGDERGCSRVPCKTVRSSLVAEKGPCCA
jgi:DNA-binding NtrC family response regulator